MKLIKSCILFLLGLVCCSLSLAESHPTFKFVKSIGDDRDSHFFAAITSIKFNDKNELFVLDNKLMQFSRYSFEGELLSRYKAPRGRGPGDFIDPTGIQLLNDKVYIFDFWNNRLAITDNQFRTYTYLKIDCLRGSKYNFRNDPKILSENRFLGIYNKYLTDQGRLIIFDEKQKAIHSFFQHQPATMPHKKPTRMYNYMTHPILGVNFEKKHMLVTFEIPDTEIPFFIYDFSGKLLGRHSFMQNKKFNFPFEFLEDKSKRLTDYSRVNRIFSYKEYYLVFFSQYSNINRPNKETKYYILFIHPKSGVKYKIESDTWYMGNSQDGYFAGIKNEGDGQVILIHKLEM